MPRVPKPPAALAHESDAFIPTLDNLHFSWQFKRSRDLDQLPEQATALDFYFSFFPEVAVRCIGVVIDGKIAPLSTIPQDDQSLDFHVSGDAKPKAAWLTFVHSPAREFIKQSLALPMTPDEWSTYENAKRIAVETARTWRHSAANQHEHTTPTAAATGYLQPGRAGKKLIGAYIDKADAARLKSLLAAQGVTVQEFFADAVTKALTADTSPAQRERLIEAQVERYRANLRANLK